MLKLLFVIGLIAQALSSNCQKLDHDYKSDSVWLAQMDGSVERQKAYVSTIRFYKDSISKLRIVAPDVTSDLKVIDVITILRPMEGVGYVSIFITQDLKTLLFYKLILIFDPEFKLVSVGLADTKSIMGFKIEE